MSVRIRWKSGIAASSYQIWRNTVNNSSTATMIADNVTGSTYVDTGATAGTTYYYWLKAKNSLGTSAFGSVISGMGVLKPPTQVLATLMDDTVEITWNASAGASTYQVQRSTTEDFTSWTNVGTTTGTSYTDNPPNHDTPYFYRIVAKTGGSYGHSDPSIVALGFKTIAVPDVPTGFGASDTFSDGIHLNWFAAARAQIYKIYRGTVADVGLADLIATTSDLDYVDTTAEYGVWYRYYIRAFNYAGGTIYAYAPDGVMGLRACPIEYPSTVEASDGTGSTVLVEWSEVAGAVEYSIYRDGDLMDTIAAVSGTNSWTDLTPTPGTHTYAVSAHTEDCEGPTNSDTGYAVFGPGVPTGFSATDTLTDKVTCSWSPVSGATSYKLYRDGSLLASGITGTSYDDTTLVIASTHSYYVTAVDGTGESSASTADNGTRVAPPFSYHKSQADGTSGSVTASYAYALTATFTPYTVADRLILNVNGSLVFDTSCTSSTSSASFSVSPGDVISWGVFEDCFFTGSLTDWNLDIVS